VMRHLSWSPSHNRIILKSIPHRMYIDDSVIRAQFQDGWPSII
jgi:hypothetical protein